MRNDVDIDVDIHEAGATEKIQRLRQSAVDLHEQMEKMRAQNDLAGLEKLKKQGRELNREIKKIEKESIDLNKVLKNLNGVSLNDLEKSKRKLVAQLKNLNRETDEYRRKTSHLNKVQGEIDKVKKSWFNARKETENNTSAVAKYGKVAVGALAGGVLISGIATFMQSVIETRKEMEKYQAVLTNTFQNKEKAAQSLAMIKAFAAETPFQVNQLTESYVKLANRGFVATKEEMTKLGDIASNTGKDMDQLVEALLDAQTGEFERLKEFGIRASKSGDKVTFAFKGVKTQTDFTEKSIQKYILSLGELTGVQGSMAAISATMAGRLSNLEDKWGRLKNNFGAQSQQNLTSYIGLLGKGIDTVADWMEIKTSDKLKAEQTEIELLVASIVSLNEGNTTRKDLLIELTSAYPEHFGNIDIEKVKNGELLATLKDINVEYEKRITQNILKEDIEAIGKKMATEIRAKMNAVKEVNEAYKQLFPEGEDTELSAMIDKIKSHNYEQETSLMGRVNLRYEDIYYIDQAVDAYDDYIDGEKEVARLMNERLKLNKELSALTPKGNDDDATPKEGDTKTVGNVIYKYTSGQWVVDKKLGSGKGGEALFHDIYQVDYNVGKKPVTDPFADAPTDVEMEEEVEIEMTPEMQQAILEADEMRELFKGTVDYKRQILDQQLAEGLISQKKYNKEQEKLDKAVLDNKLSLTADVMGQLAGLFGEETAAYKFFASGRAVIDTYLAATAALSPPPTGLGPLAGIPLAASTVAAGLANVAQINGVKLGQHFEGRYDVIGEKDNRLYKNTPYLGAASSGIYSRPAIIADHGSELIINYRDLQRLQNNRPDVLNEMMSIIKGSPSQSLRDGGAKALRSGGNSTVAISNDILAAALLEFNDTMRTIKDDGINANVYLDAIAREQEYLNDIEGRVGRGR